MSTPLRVLIVEDQATDAELIALDLEREGFAADWLRVETENEYLKALLDEPEVVLSDWRLPHFSGMRALELQRSLRPEIPFIIVSGRIGEELAVEVVRQGADDYVTKDHRQRLGIVVKRVLAERRLRGQQAKAKETIDLQVAALEAAANGIVITDRDGMIEWVNSAFSALTGYTAQEVLRRNPRELLNSGAHPRAFYQAMWGTITDGRVWRGEMRNRRKDGTLYDEEMTITPVRDEAGRVSHFIAIKQDVTERMQRERELEGIARLCTSLRATGSRDEMLPIILDEVAGHLGATGGAIELHLRSEGEVEVVLARGSLAETHGMRVPELLGFSALVRTEELATSSHRAAVAAHMPAVALGEHVDVIATVPLVADGVRLGSMSLARPTPLSVSELRAARALADIAASAIQRQSLHEETRHAAVELSAAYETTIEGWSRALDLRDRETEGHTQRVTELTLRLARAAGIGEDELVHVRRGALLHDIGKMGVPDAILLKPGKLTDDEWVVMRQHPTFARDLLEPIEFLHPAIDIPFCHHEKWDGTGYPRGLRAEEIPFVARLFAVVDVWDALRSDRPYRKGWTEEATELHIKDASGTHFDPVAVELFLQVMHAPPASD